MRQTGLKRLLLGQLGGQRLPELVWPELLAEVTVLAGTHLQACLRLGLAPAQIASMSLARFALAGAAGAWRASLCGLDGQARHYWKILARAANELGLPYVIVQSCKCLSTAR
jgi:hypothetical protein